MGTASQRNHDYLRSLGAVPVSYGDGLVERVREVAPQGVGEALDASGTVEALRASLGLVVDDVASVQPWRVRCLEIRGEAEAIDHPTDTATGDDSAIIRIHPRRIISWGIDPPELARGKRDVPAHPTAR